jgi:hypothetical protein
MRLLGPTAALLIALLGPGGAPWAHAETARHSDVKVTPIKQGGQTVGAQVSVILRPGGSSRGTPDKAFVGLGRATNNGFTRPNDAYALVYDKAVGYLRHQGDWVDVAGKPPVEHTLKILYGAGNDLKPGDKVDVFSVWRIGQQAWHLWGSVFYYGQSADVVELPH